jgi:hypothetical protein
VTPDEKSGVTPAAFEQRVRSERRRRSPLLADWRWALRGRRRQIRRESDCGRVQVDWIEPRLLAVVLAILLLSALDAAFTLDLLRAGVVIEVNPFMRALVHEDIHIFVNLKMVITASALVFLVACSKATLLSRVTVSSILYGLLFLYLGLVAYELYLLRLASEVLQG